MRWTRVRAVAMALGTALVVAACGGDSGSTEARPATASEALVVVGPFELHSLDPSTAGGFFTRLQVTETLVDADPQGLLRPGLAAGWEVSEDQLVWRFALRTGARFHDGTAVTAAAAAASLERAQDRADTLLATAPVTSIVAVDHEVHVVLEEPFAPLPAVLAHTSTQVLAPASYGSDGTVTEVIGSGPYAVQRIQQPAAIEVVASEHWGAERPAIAEVHYQAVGRAETRALMAESGQAHVTFGMDPVSLQRVSGAAGIEVSAVTLPRSILLKVNAGHELLADVAVRRALSLALDRPSMTTALLRDPEMAATQLFPPSLEGWHQPALEPLEHRPAEARALLAEAGWEPGADGVLVRDGRRFVLTLRTFPDRPELPTLATAIQAALADVGIEADVRIGNSSDIPAGHQDGSLELALFSRNFALVPDPLVTLIDDYGPEGADWGAMSWSDAELVTLLGAMGADAEAADDPSHRERVAEILHAELPVIPVAWYRQSAVVADEVDGFVLDPLERSWLLSELSWAG